MKDQDSNDGFRHSDPALDEALEWLLCLEAKPHDQPLRHNFIIWYQQCPSHKKAFDSVSALWSAPDFAAALLNHEQRSGQVPKDAARYRVKFGTRLMWSAISAAAVLVAAIYFYPSIRIRMEADYLTTTGQQQLVKLPDGSSALLNTASAIAIDFANGRRSVKLLDGEAFFEVVHDPNHPFIVSGHFSNAEVKGTAFAVETSSDMDRVVLERGRVEVRRSRNASEALELSPDEMVTAFEDHISGIEQVDVATELAWRSGRIDFSNEKLETVVATLRRYYRGLIIVASSHVAETPVSGSVRIDNPEGGLRSLAETTGATFSHLPGGVIILR